MFPGKLHRKPHLPTLLGRIVATGLYTFMLMLIAEKLPAKAAVGADGARASHGYTVGTALAYPSTFTHFRSAAPGSNRSCDLRLSTITNFDSLNPWIIRGRYAPGIFEFLYDSLLETSVDELQAGYGLVAQSVTVSPDRHTATFTLRPDARFHDGQQITADDVLFTSEVMRTSGRPFWRSLLRDMTVEVMSDMVVRVTFPDDGDPSDILAFGALPVLPKHYWATRDFGDVTLEIPLGSGPYKITEVEPGQFIRFDRVDDYWAEQLPVRLGTNHFRSITYRYISDKSTRYLSFLRGDIDQLGIDDMRQWESYAGHDAIRQNNIKILSIPAWWPMGMNGFFFNLHDERFQDRRVRKALALLMPFDWVNETQLLSAFRRTSSFFGNTDHEASGVPTPAEQSLMKRFPEHFPPQAFSEAWTPLDASRTIRESLEKALALFEEAGWVYDESSAQLRRVRDGLPLNITVLTSSTTQDKIFAAWEGLLRRAGVAITLQRVDVSSFEHRYRNSDFEMVYRFYIPPVRPGDEQITMWGGPHLQEAGAETILGIDSPAVDDALTRLSLAQSEAERTLAATYLDRALQWGVYAVPTYQNSGTRTAYWADRIQPPTPVPLVGGAAGFWLCGGSDETRPLGG